MAVKQLAQMFYLKGTLGGFAELPVLTNSLVMLITLMN